RGSGDVTSGCQAKPGRVRVEGESPMERSSREGRPSTRPTWETLEAWVRVKVREFVQAGLEEEVAEAVGGPRCERRGGIDAPVGHRNGYEKPRRLALQTGTNRGPPATGAWARRAV